MTRGNRNTKRKIKRILLKSVLYIFGIILLLSAGLWGLIYAGFFGPLPDRSELADLKEEQATLVYSADNILIGKIFAKNRTPITFENIPEHLVNALIVTEDKRFYDHRGIDGRGLLRVVFKTILMGNKSSGGGSTITQQLAKNLYGRKDFGMLSLPINKIREAILAARLEKVYSKEDILLLYFNSVPFGEDVFGIEAAANRYYNKNVTELTIDESTLLVGILKGNTYYHPRLHPDRAIERRNLILDLLNQNEKLSDEEAQRIKEKPLKLDYSNLNLEGPAQYFLFQVEKQCRKILENLVKDNGEPFDIEKDGLKIETTLDSRLQKMAIHSINDHLKNMQSHLDKDLVVLSGKKQLQQNYNYQNKELREIWSWDGVKVEDMSEFDSVWHYHKMLHAGMLALEPETGKVRVWVGGNHFRYLPYDLVLANRMIASAFKPVIYATALEEGFEPCDYFDNEIKTYEKYENWTPNNYDGTSGDEVAMWYALTQSLNLPTVDLFFKIGFNRVEEMSFRLGIEKIPDKSPSIALGAIDLSLLEMVPVYATFANAGLKVEPVMIERISDTNGRIIYEMNPIEKEDVLDRDIAYSLTSMLQKAINEGTGSRLRSQFSIRSDVAGKTGTSQKYSDAWFFNYNPGLACGVWVGARDPQIHFTSGDQGSGSSLALPIAGRFLKEIEKDPTLKKTYLRPFRLPLEYMNRFNCEPVRTKGGLNRFFENMFGKKEAKLKDTTREEESKVKQFFKRLFKKKKK